MDQNIKHKDESVNKIIELFSKYENDPYMLSKTHNYICNQLPTILEKIKQSREEQIVRIETMTEDQNSFIEYFLNTNRYFYVSSTEKFFFYDGFRYQITKEDDILYNVLTSINKDSNIMTWKQRTKVYVMKRIKDNSLLKSIPESYTIQTVIDLLYPVFFQTKLEAKYFLTILGDNILKKNSNLIHYVDSKAKHFIRELNSVGQSILNLNLYQTFKYKYHEQHSYADCRLLRINDTIKSEVLWINIINTSALDLICVACHYSNRYKNSDNILINNSNDNEITNHIFYLKNMKTEDMITYFISDILHLSNKNVIGSQLIIENSSVQMRTTQITWKNMQYLWKQYLDTKKLPNIMFQNTLKNYLIERLHSYYVEEQDSFVGICSKYLPDIQKFLNFWNETIEYDETETDFEIEEITFLFRKWCDSKGETFTNMNDKQIIDLITYYYPTAEIDRDKYICKIRCSLWDKQMDIHIALENLKEHITSKYYKEYGSISNYERTSSPLNGQNISIYDAYKYYCAFFSSQNKPIVNKSYFEKYVFDNLDTYIIESKFIRWDWILSA
jgi:hypothetical protein